MKTPCELVVWYVLPMIRRGLADELIDHHHLSQADVARLYGVTDSAVSSYRSKKRSFCNQVTETKQYPDLKYMFERGAMKIMNGMNVQSVICEICTNVKRSGLLDIIHEIVTGEDSKGKYAYNHVIYEISQRTVE
ncbi:MAG: transcriptional regulator [Methanomassiliicoccales archaeon]